MSQPKTAIQRHYDSAKNKLESVLQHDLAWIKTHPSETIAALRIHEYAEGKKYNDVTIRNFITFILKSFKDEHAVDGKVPEDLNMFYQQFLAIHRQVSKKNEDSGSLSWQQVRDKLEELSKNEFGSRRHVVLAVLCLIDPLRNDFQDVLVFGKTPGKKAVKDLHTNHSNYIILNNRVRRLFMFDNTGEVKTYPIGKDLFMIMKKYCQLSKYLIADLEGKPYSPSSYTYFCNSLLKDLFNDDGVSLTKLKETYVKSFELGMEKTG